MDKLKKIMSVVAFIGYISSIIIYVLSFQGINPMNPLYYAPLVIALFGSFVIGIISINFDPEIRGQMKNKIGGQLSLKLMFKGTPIFILVLAAASFVFAIINAFYAIFILPDKVFEIDKLAFPRMMIGQFVGFFGLSLAMLMRGTKKA